MALNFINSGERPNYVNKGSETILSGEPLMFGPKLAVAYNDIEPGEIGPVALKGAWRLPASLASAVVQGQELYFAESTGQVTDASMPSDPVCLAWEDAPAGDGDIAVVLL